SRIKMHFPHGAKFFMDDAFFKIFLEFAPRPDGLWVELPEGKRFQVSAAEDAESQMVSTAAPTWIHFSHPDIPATFLTYVTYPSENREVFHPQGLRYQAAQGKEAKPGTAASLACDIRLTPQKGDHLL